VDRNAVVIADAEGVIRFWSEGAQSAFGILADEALGQTLDLIVPEEFQAQHWAGFRRAMATGSAEAEDSPGPFPVRIASGAIVPIPGRLQLIRDPGGRVLGAAVVFEPV
jgi:PAS domain S-box-containing protein